VKQSFCKYFNDLFNQPEQFNTKRDESAGKQPPAKPSRFFTCMRTFLGQCGLIQVESHADKVAAGTKSKPEDAFPFLAYRKDRQV
jgi:hypothetical protein